MRHSTTKQNNLLYINKTVYYIKIRKRHALYVPAGAFIFLKNSVCVFSVPAGAFLFSQTNCVFVFSAPAGAFSEPKIAPLGFSVPKIASFCVFNIEMWAGGGRGLAGEGKVWFRVHETILWDTAGGSRLSSGSTGSNVVDCSSDPTFHTRRGPG